MTIARQRFGKHRLKAGVATNKQTITAIVQLKKKFWP
jgi:hypothetical protein